MGFGKNIGWDPLKEQICLVTLNSIRYRSTGRENDVLQKLLQMPL